MIPLRIPVKPMHFVTPLYAIGQLMCQFVQRTLTLSTILMATTLLCNDGHDAWASAQQVLRRKGVFTDQTTAHNILQKGLLNAIINEQAAARAAGQPAPDPKAFLDHHKQNPGMPIEKVGVDLRMKNRIKELFGDGNVQPALHVGADTEVGADHLTAGRRLLAL